MAVRFFINPHSRRKPMIKQIGIVNFQSHQETMVEFGNGLNVIAGESDKGKSAILRAFSWVWKNRPSGDSIKNWEAGKKDSVAVEMVLVDQNGREASILKERIGSTASYTLSTLNKPLDVVGRDVPTEVQEMINFSELNYKGQHDPYLLSISGGALAKMINNLVGLSIIDVSTKNLNRKVSMLKGQCESLTAEIERANAAVEQLSYLDEMNADIEEIERLTSVKIEKEKTVLELGKILQAIQKTETEIEDNEETLKAQIYLNKMLDVLYAHKSNAELASSLKIEIGFIETLQKGLAEEKEILQAEPKFLKLREAIKKYSEEKKRLDLYSRVVVSAIEIEEGIKAASDNIVIAQKKLADYLSMVRVCPTCKHPFDKETIKEMTK